MKIFLTLTLMALAAIPLDAQAQPADSGPNDAVVETIVCIRHGEKPKNGLGQLTCRGLNRALALPNVLTAKFGQPQFIFAPNPQEKIDGTGHYYYVRPLMTIEPTAVRCGLPVNTKFGYLEIKPLEHELDKPEYRSATIFIAWEHVLVDDFVRALMKDHGGDPAKVPSWQGSDFDSIFVVKITRSGAPEKVSFTIEHEGLNNLSDVCP